MADSEYLNNLKFNPKDKSTFVYKYLGNIRVIFLILLVIVLAGITSYINLPRRLNPGIEIPIIAVNTILPGGSPEDIEKLITIPIENELNSLDDVNSVTSTSQDSVSTIIVEFKSSVSVDDARSEVQKAVDKTIDLPNDATTPQVLELDFEDIPVVTFALTTNSDYGSLNKYSELVQDRLESLPHVNKVNINGAETREIQIILSQEKLRQFGLNPIIVSQLISQELSSYPSGTINTDSTNYQLSVDTEINNLEELRGTILNVNGDLIKLGDIAEVSENSKPTSSKSYLQSSNEDISNAISFEVFKTPGTDIDVSTEEISNELELLKAESGNFTFYITSNFGTEINEQFDELGRNTLITVILVFITLFIFLGIRQASVTSLSIPLTFLISFTVMNMTGLTLNFLSSFSLLLSLGLIVDTAIVIVTAMTQYYRTKKFTAQETGYLVWKDFKTAVWATTLTTVWAFLPLLLASGIIGEFIKSIPIVVTATLIASTSIALLITLPVMVQLLDLNLDRKFKNSLLGLLIASFLLTIVILLPKTQLLPLILLSIGFIASLIWLNRKYIGNKANNITQNENVRIKTKKVSRYIARGIVDFRKISAKYKNIISKILVSKFARINTLILVIIFSLFSYLLVPLGLVPNIFFPTSNENVVYISIETPTGTNIDITEEVGLSIFEEINGKYYADFSILEIGKGLTETSLDTSSGSTNKGLISIRLIDEKKRPSSVEISENIRSDFKNYNKAKVNVIEVSGGPPAGAAVQVTLLGDDFVTLNNYADETVQYLEDINGTLNVDKSIKPSPSKLTFKPDKSKLSQQGLTVQDLGLWLRIYASGFTVDESDIIDTPEDTEIVIRTSESTESPATIDNIYIPNNRNEYIPLNSLGTIILKPNPSKITREDGKRSITVTSAVKEGFNSTQINQELGIFVDTELDLPAGYTWKTGGENEENQKSVQSIIQAMGLSAILILATMVILLGSFRKAVIVLLVIPLAISGVFIIFAITKTPLSFPALIGILALFGIVVNNSIILLDKINQNLRSGMEFLNSIIDAATSRLEPIAFSSLTTIIGLIPITMSDPLWRGLGGAIIAGLTFSGTIMLFFIPVVYYMIFHKKYENQKLMEK